MQLNWLQCLTAQEQFRFYLEKGSTNMADYHTKHHSLSHNPLRNLCQIALAHVFAGV